MAYAVLHLTDRSDLIPERLCNSTDLRCDLLGAGYYIFKLLRRLIRNDHTFLYRLYGGLNQYRRFLCSLGALRRQYGYLIGYDSKSLASFSCTGSLNGSI